MFGEELVVVSTTRRKVAASQKVVSVEPAPELPKTVSPAWRGNPAFRKQSTD